MDEFTWLSTLVASVGAGLVAGIFFAFSTFVMKALGRLPPAHGIAAMQFINVTVINPWFLTVFFGTAAVCAVLLVFSLLDWQRPGAGMRLAGSLLYLVGTILVTIACNVPRNDALAAVEAESDEGGRLWDGYLVGWTAWNHVRTLAALAAAVLLALALRN